MLCGKQKSLKFNLKNNEIVNNIIKPNKYKTVNLYTAYLGCVKLEVLNTNVPNKVLLESRAGRGSDIIVRVIDAKKNKVNYKSYPRLRQLSYITPTEIDINENRETFYRIQNIEAKKAKMRGDNVGYRLHINQLYKLKKNDSKVFLEMYNKFNNELYDPKLLHSLYIKNSCVDIHFNTQQFLMFLRDKLNRESINSSKLLISIYNVDKLDNAFFSGEYMLYGNGDSYFYPLSAIDVTAHELTHGLIQYTTNLEYEGHSGALNESFADVMGTSFEFWLYDKFNNDSDPNNDILGKSDWLCGEDVGKTIKYLRNLRNPTDSPMPQPDTYKGRYYKNPNETDKPEDDYGGVHINSGIPNKVFYLLTEKTDKEKSLSIFYNCLLKLNSNSDFIDFRNTLIKCSPENIKNITTECLSIVGLSLNAYSDWNKSPEENRKRPNNTETKTNESTEKDKFISYPNSHYPFIRGLCCPHCLCLQGKKVKGIKRSRDEYELDD